MVSDARRAQIKERNRLNKAWVESERLPGIKFRYNSLVRFVGADGVGHDGWVVAVTTCGPEPVYTIECRDGAEDAEVRESALQLIHEPD